MNQQQALQKIANMYERAANENPSDLNSNEKYRKAGEAYLDMGDLESTVRCFTKANLIENYRKQIFERFNPQDVIPLFEKSGLSDELCLSYLQVATQEKGKTEYPVVRNLLQLAEQNEQHNRIAYLKGAALGAYLQNEHDKIEEICDIALEYFDKEFDTLKGLDEKVNIITEKLKFVVGKLRISEDLNFLDEINNLLMLYLNLTGGKYENDYVIRVLFPINLALNLPLRDFEEIARANRNTERYVQIYGTLITQLETSDVNDAIEFFEQSCLSDSSAHDTRIWGWDDIEIHFLNIKYFRPELLTVLLLQCQHKETHQAMLHLRTKLIDAEKCMKKKDFNDAYQMFHQCQTNLYFGLLPETARGRIYELMCKCAFEEENWDDFDKTYDVLEKEYGVKEIIKPLSTPI